MSITFLQISVSIKKSHGLKTKLGNNSLFPNPLGWLMGFEPTTFRTTI